jgi:transcriptional antiterminator RfaH
MESSENRPSILISKERETQKWYVLYVRSRHEKKANQLLLDDGFRTFLPLQKILKIRKTRKEWVEEPILKSYIFIKVKKYQLYSILQNPHVVTYVKFQGEPATVRENDLLFIKRMLLNETTFDIVNGDFAVGKEITIKTGYFAGLKGNISEIRGKNNLVIQIKSLNTSIVIPMSDIIPPTTDKSSKTQSL